MNEGPLGPARTILLVEDDVDLAFRIKTELEGNGYRVYVVSIAEATDIAAHPAVAVGDRKVVAADTAAAELAPERLPQAPERRKDTPFWRAELRGHIESRPS